MSGAVVMPVLTFCAPAHRKAQGDGVSEGLLPNCVWFVRQEIHRQLSVDFKICGVEQSGSSSGS